LTEGTILATVGYDHVVSPKPTFHGDAIYTETEVLEKRESKSRPDVWALSNSSTRAESLMEQW
jgi:acyl dehydratase